ncbi:uncharacterized protein LOC111245042 isoform X3 [Varroa destructor]|uniref:K Homology domain-containing protein n=1 Tax=Varroa destructor TaxID=109461 RepID=A0A7M7J901_VARDE|nr:uncharacterized protein LOC111245042 isoform X3 [Varroa destructor]
MLLCRHSVTQLCWRTIRGRTIAFSLVDRLVGWSDPSFVGIDISSSHLKIYLERLSGRAAFYNKTTQTPKIEGTLAVDQVAVARIMSRLERNFFAPEVREPRHVSFHPSRSNGNMTDISCLSTSAYLLQYHMEHRDYFSRTASANPHKMDLSFDEPSKPLRNGVSGERVTLKMDVSFSDHSFIIGRGGKGIQGVMRETGCHIHFPDSNRNHRSEKSNQVSVAGPPAGVVAARQRIREHLPISFAFMVDKDDYRRAVTPSESASKTKLEPKAKVKHMIEALQNEFRMTITWLPMENFSCAMVTVRGRQSNFERIREGLRRLTAFLRPGQPPPYVHLGIEVSPHHLSFVMGAGEVKMKTLMQVTGTEFIIPPIRSDTSHHIPTVRIFGEVDNVYQAWLAFMDLLPVVLHIDIPDTVEVWRGRNFEYRDRSGEHVHDTEAINNGEQSAPWPLSGPIGDRRQQQQHRQHRASTDHLQELREFVSPEVQTTVALNGTELDGDTGVLNPVFRRLATSTDHLNSMLRSYDISLMLRLGRDSRHWRMVAKGPEKHVDLLIDVYRAIRDSSHDPIASIRNALLVTPMNSFSLNSPPAHSFPAFSSLIRSSSFSDARTNSDEIRLNNATWSSRCSSTASCHGRSNHDLGCVPCEMLGSQETCEMFAKLLKISRELSSEGPAFGYYTITPSSGLNDEQRRSSRLVTNNNETLFPSTPYRYSIEYFNHYFGGRYPSTGSRNGSNSTLHHGGVHNASPGFHHSTGSGSEYSPWNGVSSFDLSVNNDSASRGLYSYGDSLGASGRGSISSYSMLSHNEEAGSAHRRTSETIYNPARQGCSGNLEVFPHDGRGDCPTVKEFDAAPGAGRDHR